MSSSSSSLNSYAFQTLLQSGHKGGEWTKKIYFDPDASQNSGTKYLISESGLKMKLQNLIDWNDSITDIRIYSEKLDSWLPCWGVLHHAFVVIRSNTFWWSVEKNTHGITIQRARDIIWVRNKYRHEDRNEPIEAMEKWLLSSSEIMMSELVDWLSSHDELNKPYNLSKCNCQHFAWRLFNCLTKQARCCASCSKRPDKSIAQDSPH